jgi:uncharacterized protein (TIRG00374 family)
MQVKENMASKSSGIFKIVLKVAVAAALIIFMVRSGHLDPKELWGLMTPFNVTMALLVCGLNMIMAAWRWLLLLKARGFYVPFLYGLQLYLIGIFFNHALPGAVGGDLVRGYYLVAEHPERKADAILSIVIDRVLGLYSFFFLTLIAVMFDYGFVMGHEKIRWVAMLCFFIFAGMTVFFTIAFSKRLMRVLGLKKIFERFAFLQRQVDAFQRFGQDPKIIGLSVLVSTAAQVLTMVFFYQVGVVTGEDAMTWKAVLFAVPMGFVVTAVPIAPAGIGVGQVAFHYLFSVYLDKPTQVGTTAITAFQMCVVCYALLGAIIYLRRRRPKELATIGSAMEMPTS